MVLRVLHGLRVGELLEHRQADTLIDSTSLKLIDKLDILRVYNIVPTTIWENDALSL